LNPVIDQERAEFLAVRLANAKRQLLPPWMRPEKELPVVDLPIEWVRFSTLNHRTRAEQMREIEISGVTDLFTGDPMGSAAQESQLNILSSQEGFESLKQDLRERGQRELAVVTAEGVLINGNRRSAALRDLWLKDHVQSARYVRTYVLPADATADELIDLETELQVAKDYREDYSWVNEALLIEEIFEASNKDWDRVAQRMRLKPVEVRAQYEKLQQLHQLVAMSNGTRHHADFVDNESAFEELSKHIKDKPLDEAASVRSVYFLGTLAGVNYRDLRHLRRKDASAFVRGEFVTDPTLTSLLSFAEGDGTAADDLLDDVLGARGSTSSADLTSVLSFLVQRKPDEIVDLPDGAKVPVEQLLGSVHSAVNSAAKEASEVTKDAQAVVAPILRLSAAREDIARAGAALAKARSHGSWDEAGFKKKLEEVKAAILQIEAL
jgi:hypothetical protein